jgi:molybdenum cofactor guanylyltransferase
MAYDAIVLAGGASSRHGGRDKTALEVDGRSVLDRVLAAVEDAERVTVVGPEVQGGPVAAVAGGLAEGGADLVVTLAGDQPFVAGAIAPLLTALDVPDTDAGADVAVLTSGGRRHYLTAAWRRPALAAALARLGDPADAAMRRLFDGVVVREVADEGGWSDDVDTPEALDRARTRAHRST